MGFRNNSYAKVWEITDHGKYATVDMSISRKNKETGNYDTTFKYKFVRFVGKAFDKVLKLEKGSSIKITECDVEYFGKQKEDGTWQNIFKPIVYDFDVEGGSSMPSADDFMAVPDGDDEFMPFV